MQAEKEFAAAIEEMRIGASKYPKDSLYRDLKATLAKTIEDAAAHAPNWPVEGRKQMASWLSQALAALTKFETGDISRKQFEEVFLAIIGEMEEEAPEDDS